MKFPFIEQIQYDASTPVTGSTLSFRVKLQGVGEQTIELTMSQIQTLLERAIEAGLFSVKQPEENKAKPIAMSAETFESLTDHEADEIVDGIKGRDWTRTYV